MNKSVHYEQRLVDFECAYHFQISEMHVITAAHCVYNWTPDAFLVTIGDENVNPNIRDRDEGSYKVHSFETHPKYVNCRLDHDLAIIRLEHKVTWSDNAQPLCICER